MVPFAKTGGLADVVGSLASEIRALGHEVVVFVPGYKSVDPARWDLKPAVEKIEIAIGSERERGRVLTHTLEGGVQACFVDHPAFFARAGFYGTALGDFPDND